LLNFVQQKSDEFVPWTLNTPTNAVAVFEEALRRVGEKRKRMEWMGESISGNKFMVTV